MRESLSVGGAGEHEQLERALFVPRSNTHPEWFGDLTKVYPLRAGGLPSRYQTAVQSQKGFLTLVQLGEAFSIDNVLEIGCGPNPISPVFSRGPNVGRFLLMDLLEHHTRFAKEAMQSFQRAEPEIVSRNISTITADARTIPLQLANERLSLVVMPELVTHIRPEKRESFLQMWAERTEGMIVDRYARSPEAVELMNDYVLGEEVRGVLGKAGFLKIEMRILTIGFPERAVGPSEYFFLAAKRS